MQEMIEVLFSIYTFWCQMGNIGFVEQIRWMSGKGGVCDNTADMFDLQIDTIRKQQDDEFDTFYDNFAQFIK